MPHRPRASDFRWFARVRVGLATLVLAVAAWFGPAQGAHADEDRPQAFYVLLDLSASMNAVPEGWQQTKLQEAKARLGEFLSHLPYETPVHVFTFSDSLVLGPSVVLTGEGEREQLRAFFGKLEAKGRATHAWSSLDRVLARARQQVERSPGITVRVLLYTDGEDNEEPRVNLAAMLARYADLLKQSIEASVVPMGFKLDLTVRETLKAGSVGVIDALRAEDLIPLVSILDWEPRQPTTRDEVHFIDASRGAISSRTWDFGDGAKSVETAPRHTYSKPGEYVVGLEVKGFTGRTATARRKLRVGAPDPLKAAGKASPLEVPAGAPVQFVSESTGAIKAFVWDFGDGTSSAQANPTHVYADPGSYTARLVVSGAGGETQEVQVGPIVVKGPDAPEAEFYGPDKALVGETIRFLDASRGVVTSRTWDFGDGGQAETAAEVEHVFSQAGAFKVVLRVVGPGGERHKERAIAVAAPPVPVAGIAAPGSVRVGEEAVFSDVSQGLIDVALWRFSDGTPDLRVDYRTANNPDARSVRRTFGTAGQVDVSLTVTGPGGSHVAAARVQVASGESAPRAAFGGPGMVDQRLSGVAPLEVSFENLSTGSARRFTWTFGDGTPPLVQEGRGPATHRYVRAGDYEVVLVAEGPPGFPPSRATGGVTVRPPPGFFERYRTWLLLAGAALLACLVVLLRGVARRRRVAALGWFSGTLRVRPAGSDDPFAELPVPRSRESAALPLESALAGFPLPSGDARRSLTVRVRVEVTDVPGQVFHADVSGAEGPLGTTPLDPVEPARLADLDLLFIPG